MTEDDLLARVEVELNLGGWRWHHCPRSIRCHGGPGWPDIIAFRPGRILAAELKSDDGRPSREQLRAGVDIARSGAAWRLWDPSHLERGIIQHEIKGD